MTTTVRDTAVQPDIILLLAMLDDAYEREAWHGPGLLGSVRRVRADEAAWRPAPGQRNIWEYTVHAAYWKYAVWRRLTDAKRGSFPRKGSNWFVRPSEGETARAAAPAWRDDLALLDEMHRRLREAVAALDLRQLHVALPGKSVTNAAIVSGIALHDVYHAGQIQQLRSLYSAAHRGAAPPSPQA